MRRRWAGKIHLQPVCLIGLERMVEPLASQLADLVAQSAGVLGRHHRRLAHPGFRPAASIPSRARTRSGPGYSRRRKSQSGITKPRPDRRSGDGLSRQGPRRSLLQFVGAGQRNSRVDSRQAASGRGQHLEPAHVQPLPPGPPAPAAPRACAASPCCTRCAPSAFLSPWPATIPATPFTGYGDLDLLETFTQGARIAHLDRPIGDWPATVCGTPAKIMGIEAGVIKTGAPRRPDHLRRPHVRRSSVAPAEPPGRAT